MAKAAKTVEVEITERIANKFVRDIIEHYENIETARGTFMNKARREREGMAAIYETMAAKGVPQKVSKTNIKIVRALEKIKGWMADLEAEDRKMAQKLAKAQSDKRQLMLFGELPAIKGPTKAEVREREKQEKAETKPPKSDLETTEPVGAA